ncbi:MAG: TRAP transporter substrate-binding protein DctP [Alphaproteobacteria bacterium]
MVFGIGATSRNLAAFAFCIAGVTAMPAASAQTVDGPAVQWDIALYGNPRSVTIVFDETAKMVEEATGGKFKIKNHYGATLAPEREILDGLSIGAYQGGWVVVSYAPGKLVAAGGLDLPFIPVTTLNALQEVQDSYLRLPEVDNDFKRWGAKYLAPSGLPFYEFLGKGRPLQAVADFKGLRLRGLGGLGDAIRAVGGVPTTFTSSELYPALERGLLDGLSMGYYAHQAWKIHEVATWYTKGMALTPPVSLSLVNLKAFEALPPQYQRLVAEKAVAGANIQLAALQKGEDDAEADFIKKGVKRIDFTAAERDKLAEQGGKPVWAKWVQEVTAKGYPGQKLLDFIMTAAKKASS